MSLKSADLSSWQLEAWVANEIHKATDLSLTRNLYELSQWPNFHPFNDHI